MGFTLSKKRSRAEEQTKAMHDGSPRASRLLAGILSELRAVGVGLFAISGTVNLLALTGSFFMLQVYDRVLPGRSVPTLVGLCILAIGLYAFQGVLDAVRSRILVRLSAYVDERLGPKVFQLTAQLPLLGEKRNDGSQPVRDLDQIRAFISGPGPLAFFDLPWLPVYLGVCFLFHPLIGTVASVGALVLIVMTVIVEVLTHRHTSEALVGAAERNLLADASRDGSEVLRAMGFAHRMEQRWAEAGRKYMQAQGRLSDLSGGFSAMSRALRMMLQSAVLATGAMLVLQQQASAGIIIAGSIIAARALSPVDIAISNWKGFANARQSYARLAALVGLLPEESAATQMPLPTASLETKSLTLVPPGGNKPTVANVSMRLEAGQGLGIIGPSAAGKSSLVRGIVGIWPAVRGSVRLDGATLDRWTAEQRGRFIGYLPQSADLLSGTIAENISRFDPGARPEAVIEAAKLAGIHEMVLRLPEGYDTDIGERGTILSAGQRQRVALARAVYGNPFLVVLDEPNSNLDSDGDAALHRAIVSIRRRGGIAIVVAHRPNTLAALSHVLVMKDGIAQSFGPKDEIIEKFLPGKVRRQGKPSVRDEPDEAPQS